MHDNITAPLLLNIALFLCFSSKFIYRRFIPYFSLLYRPRLSQSPFFVLVVTRFRDFVTLLEASQSTCGKPSTDQRCRIDRMKFRFHYQYTKNFIASPFDNRNSHLNHFFRCLRPLKRGTFYNKYHYENELLGLQEVYEQHVTQCTINSILILNKHNKTIFYRYWQMVEFEVG